MNTTPAIPTGKIPPEAAAVFGIVIGVIGVVVAIGAVIADAYEWVEEEGS